MTVSGHESGHSDEEDNVMNPSDQKTRVHKQNELVNWACYILKYALIYRVSPLYLIGNAADPNTYIPCKFKKGIRLTKESGNKTRVCLKSRFLLQSSYFLMTKFLFSKKKTEISCIFYELKPLIFSCKK